MFCKYCNKEYDSNNRLAQHERCCKHNPNRIPMKRPKGLNNNGRKWIHKGEINRLVFPEDIDKYLSNGWSIGYSDSMRLKAIKNHNPNSGGRCLDDNAEIERRLKISRKMKGNTHWMNNKKHGRGNQGSYMGIWCDSSWELAFLVYHIEHGMHIERCKERRPYIFRNQSKIYIPDFVTDEGLIEIKGYITEQWLAKINQNPDIIVLYEDDMRKYLDYVKSKYGNEFWKILYDNK